MLRHFVILLAAVCSFFVFVEDAQAVYSAEQGRWLTREPLGYVDGPARYIYARSAPVLRTDPSGLSDCNPVSPPPPGQAPNPQQTCCADICAVHGSRYGRVGCCQGNVVACVCANNAPFQELSPAFANQFAVCVGRHECKNTQVWGCTPDAAPDGATPAGWMDNCSRRQRNCQMYNNECLAYVILVGCIIDIQCPQGDNACEADKVRLLENMKRAMKEMCERAAVLCGLPDADL